MTRRLVVLADLLVTADLIALAEGVAGRGHTPVLFAPIPSEEADQARTRGIEVVTDAASLRGRDVWRAQARHPVAATLLRAALPGVPLVRGGRDVLDADAATPEPPTPEEIADAFAELTRWVEEEREALLAARREVDAIAVRVARRQEATRKRDLFHYRAPAGSGEGIGDLADRAWRLQEFHDRVTRSTWYAVIEWLRRTADRLFPWGSRRRGLVMAPARALMMARRQGVGALLRHLPKVGIWVPKLWRPAMPLPHSAEAYEVWHRKRYRRSAVRRMKREGAALASGPLLSIVMPAYNSEPAWLERAVSSIRAQAYPRWELCIADDASPRPETRRTLERLAARDPRIKVRYLPQNLGISGASNAALGLAEGEFVVLVDHDDELKPDALLEVAKRLIAEPELDYVYTDEDKRAPDGRLIDVFFKPDWSPDLLMSMNYLSHLSVLRRDLVERVGGFRSEFDGSQDYDLVLRVTEATERIAHVPLPLYTWRVVPGSAAGGEEAKPWAYAAARRALEDALRRRGIAGTVDFGPFIGSYAVSYEQPEGASVSVLVDGEVPAALRDIDQRVREKVPVEGDGSFGARMNRAAREAQGDLLLFVDPAVVPLDPGWIGALVEHAVRPSVAAAGGRLLYPDGSRAHEGIVVGLGDPWATGSPTSHFTLGEVVRNCSAVAGACMMIRAEVFWEFGGFDEQMGPVYGPIDLCLRAREKGYLIVYTPWATLGYEPPTDPAADPEGERLFRDRWGSYRDPYYNPNLDLTDPYAIRP